ncbi:MAG: homoserine kinase, partial [Bacteroidales bacterium]
DVIIEPVRSILIPGFDDIKQGCREAGALGGGISGSGPSVFMLSQTRETAVKVERIMCDVYDKLNIDYHTYVTTVNTDGVKVFDL